MKPGVLGDSGSKPWLFFGLILWTRRNFRAGFRTRAARKVSTIITWKYWGSSPITTLDNIMQLINEFMNNQSILIYFTTIKLGSIQCFTLNVNPIWGWSKKLSPTSHQPWFQTASPQFPYLGLQSPKRRHNGHNGTVSLEALIYVDYPLVMTNIAMENGPFIDDFPS